MAVAHARLSLPAALFTLSLFDPAALFAQHPGGAWRTAETAHYRVHARAEHQDLALRAAAVGETAWTELSQWLTAPRGKVDLVVADNIDDANGFATTYPVPVIVVFAFPPAGDVQLGSYDSWLRLVITHELVHIFHLEQTRGWWRVARALFGRVPALFPNQYTPTWLIEGTAVFYETRVTGRGRLDGAFHDAVVQAQVAELGRLPMGAAGALSPRWPGGTRPYAFGSAFVGELARRGGDSVVPRLIATIARRPLPYLQLNGALDKAAGMSLGEAWREWMERLEDECRGAGVQGCGQDSAAAETAVLRGLRSAASLRVSPDGRRLLFVHANGIDETRLGVWDRDGPTLTRLTRVNGDGGAAWTGDSVLLSQLEFTDQYTVRADLYSVNRFREERRLTHGARLREPDVDSGGAIVAVRSVPGGTELVLLEADSVALLQPTRPGIEWATPRFSPGGATIAAVRVEHGRHDIVLLDRGGAVVREITADLAADRQPAFTPDGAMLAWSRELEDGPQIVAMRLADSATFRLTRAPFAAYAPAPAGDSLFYFSYHADGYRLAAVALEPEPMAPDSGAAGDRGTGAPDETGVTIVREGGYSPFPALWPHYWLPSAIPAGAGGSFLGAFTSSQDPLGRHFYVADAGLGLGTVAGRFRGLLYYAYAGRPPAVFDLRAAREHDQYYQDSLGTIALRCCLANDELDAGLSFTRRRFRSAWSVRFGGEYERVERVGSRAGVTLSFGVARTAAAPLAISTQRGWRASTTIRRRWRLDNDSLRSTDIVLATSGYVPATVFRFARQVLALRAAAGFIGGSDRVSFGVGGVSGGSFELVPGLIVGGGSRSFPVRGYPGSSLLGRSVMAAALEFRSPVALVGRGPGLFPPVTLDRISTAAFVDFGAAWSNRYCGDSTATHACAKGITSAGGELIVDAGIPYDFPVRLRLGAAWRFGLSSVGAYAAVGSAF